MKNNSLSNVDIQIIGMIDKKILFPLSEEIVNDMKSKLQTQTKVRKTNRSPKPMNNFMVFRRCLNHVVKKSLPYDGKNLSRVAAHLWKEATADDKQCYVDLTKLLKEQHSKIYPNHIEKRNRKHRFNFVYYDMNNCQTRETGRVNITTERQEQVNEITPLPYEYGHADGLDNTLLAQQQYQQNSFYYSAPEMCQNFFIGDLNAGFYDNNNINDYANYLNTGGRLNLNNRGQNFF